MEKFSEEFEVFGMVMVMSLRAEPTLVVILTNLELETRVSGA
jgi:hypothetical protein